jgi:hypothetical protein
MTVHRKLDARSLPCALYGLLVSKKPHHTANVTSFVDPLFWPLSLAL